MKLNYPITLLAGMTISENIKMEGLVIQTAQIKMRSCLWHIVMAPISRDNQTCSSRSVLGKLILQDRACLVGL